MAGRIFSSRNKTLLIFRLVCPVKYRRKIFTSETEQTLKAICLELAPRYNHAFLEIGIDEDRVHFLVQTVPNIWLSDIENYVKKQGIKGYHQLHQQSLFLSPNTS